MMVSEDLSRGEWELRITEIRHSDAGNYECQINTNPLLSHTITLSVVGMFSLYLQTSYEYSLFRTIHRNPRRQSKRQQHTLYRHSVGS